MTPVPITVTIIPADTPASAETPPIAEASPTLIPPSPTGIASPGEAKLASHVLELVNQERAQEGLAALAHNAVLEAQATQYACEMIHYGFFAHTNPFTGTQLENRTAEFGYVYACIGENLAAGQPTPEEAFEAWMISEGHRYNILHPQFTELGVGVRTGGDYGIYWVQEFGCPQP